MAEVIGIVASGIAIGQATTAITSSLLKLKSLWNEFRAVPEDLLHLVHELEIVYLVLAESGPQGISETCTPSSRSLQLAWQLTNDGAKELKSLVDDLQAELKQNQRWKGKFVAAKIVLKRDQIKRLKSRLKTCIRLLTLANQRKISCMLERQPGLLAMELTAMTRNLDHSRQDDETGQENSQQISNPRTTPQQCKFVQSQSAFRLRIRLLYRLWYFYYYRSHTGWDFVLRAFNLISEDDPLISACIKKDDDELLRENFRTGKASPLMLVEWARGWETDTLLAYAFLQGSVKIIQLLLDEGAKIFEDSIETYSRAVFHFLANTVQASTFKRPSCIRYRCYQVTNEQLLLSLAELLLQYSQNVVTGEDCCDQEYDLFPFRGTLACFQLLQLSLHPNYYNTSFRSRTIITMSISHEYRNSPDVVRAALGIIDSSQVDIKVEFEELFGVSDIETTLLQCVARRFGHSVFESPYKPSRSERCSLLYRSVTDNLSVPETDIFDENHYPLCGWQALVGQLIRCGADPNHQVSHGTALICVVFGAFTLQSSIIPPLGYALTHPDNGRLALLAWLRMLKNSGIDLEAYGRKEASILSRENAEWLGREIPLGHLFRSYRLSLRLIGFEFGPNPEDWRFWFSEPTDQLAGEFWDMMEHPERRMPGAWDEFSW